VGTREIPPINVRPLEDIGIFVISTQVEDSPNKMFIANLPTNQDELSLL
jgi:hypothetical protein